MYIERKVVEQVLEALEKMMAEFRGYDLPYGSEAYALAKNARLVGEEALAQPEQEPTYTSTQATNCAGCGEYKHTPLRIDAMGGYVCLTCIDKKLGSLLGEFGYAQPEQEPAFWIDSLEIEYRVPTIITNEDKHEGHLSDWQCIHPLYTAPQQCKTEQEPVAWTETDEVECPVCKARSYPYPKCGHVTYTSPPQRKSEQETIHCKHKRENNGVCPHHNLQCGWPKCNEPEPEPVAKKMTAHRAVYFMERFKHEEKLLGPNEQAALDFVISMLEAQPPQRTWVGLTWDEANEIAIEHDVRPSTVKTIEAKLKEKNT